MPQTIGGDEIEYVNEQKYVDIVLDNRLTPRPRLDYVVRKAVKVCIK